MLSRLTEIMAALKRYYLQGKYETNMSRLLCQAARNLWLHCSP